MDFKLLKLKLKIVWFKLTGKLINSDQVIDFSSSKLDSPNVLIIFPIEQRHFNSATKYVYEIIDTLSNKGASFSLVINGSYRDSIKLYDIDIYTYDTTKRGTVTNLGDIVNQIYLNKFDIIIDLNFEFNVEVAMLINELSSNYKIGFSSEFSDLFYNIQLKHNKDNNGYRTIKRILS